MLIADLIVFIIMALLIVLLSYFVIIYNNLSQNKANVHRAWKYIDKLIEQRHTAIDEILKITQKHVSTSDFCNKLTIIYQEVNDARELLNLDNLADAEATLGRELSDFFSQVNKYPDLQINHEFIHLHVAINNLSDSIAERRTFYNEMARENNIRIERFPDIIIAHMFNFDFEPIFRHEQPKS